jgi:hypothetical protein
MPFKMLFIPIIHCFNLGRLKSDLDIARSDLNIPVIDPNIPSNNPIFFLS